MYFSKSHFKFFYKHCISRFGEDLGGTVYHSAERILAKMINEADYKESKAIKWHMDTNMLPTIAMYFAFKEFSTTREKAYEYTSEVLQIACEKVQKKNRIIGNMPFGYALFKLFFKYVLERQYPKEGWHYNWVKYNKEEIHVNFSSCIYLETTRKYDCLELCPLFCANDDITFSGYIPNIIFERSETLGRGQTKCDFLFINNKYRK